MSRWGRRFVVGSVVGSMVGAGLAAVVAQAAFNSTAAASQSIRSRNLVAPTTLTATPSGENVNLTWPAGQNGSGYAVLAASNGTSNACATASFSATGATTATSYADNGRYQPEGTYECYQVRTTYGTWYSVNANPTAAAQLGVVATSVTIANGGTAGQLDSGDTITITFNQPITPSTGPAAADTVCTTSGATIVLASTTTNGNSCSAAETTDLGTLTGGTSTKKGRVTATYAWSNNNRTLAITITGASASTIAGNWTFNPTTTTTGLLSATGNYHTCDTNAGGGNCLPTAVGSF
jgi:hypothetical protein